MPKNKTDEFLKNIQTIADNVEAIKQNNESSKGVNNAKGGSVDGSAVKNVNNAKAATQEENTKILQNRNADARNRQNTISGSDLNNALNKLGTNAEKVADIAAKTGEGVDTLIDAVEKALTNDQKQRDEDEKQEITKETLETLKKIHTDVLNKAALQNLVQSIIRHIDQRNEKAEKSVPTSSGDNTAISNISVKLQAILDRISVQPTQQPTSDNAKQPTARISIGNNIESQTFRDLKNVIIQLEKLVKVPTTIKGTTRETIPQQPSKTSTELNTGELIKNISETITLGFNQAMSDFSRQVTSQNRGDSYSRSISTPSGEYRERRPDRTSTYSGKDMGFAGRAEITPGAFQMRLSSSSKPIDVNVINAREIGSSVNNVSESEINKTAQGKTTRTLLSFLEKKSTLFAGFMSGLRGSIDDSSLKSLVTSALGTYIASHGGLMAVLIPALKTMGSVAGVAGAAYEIFQTENDAARNESRYEFSAAQAKRIGTYSGTAMGTTLGFFLGGPAGAAIGAGIGSFVGKYFGDYIAKDKDNLSEYNLARSLNEVAPENKDEFKAKHAQSVASISYGLISKEQALKLQQGDEEAIKDVANRYRENYNKFYYDKEATEQQKLKAKYAMQNIEAGISLMNTFHNGGTNNLTDEERLWRKQYSVFSGAQGYGLWSWLTNWHSPNVFVAASTYKGSADAGTQLPRASTDTENAQKQIDELQRQTGVLLKEQSLQYGQTYIDNLNRILNQNIIHSGVDSDGLLTYSPKTYDTLGDIADMIGIDENSDAFKKLLKPEVTDQLHNLHIEWRKASGQEADAKALEILKLVMGEVSYLTKPGEKPKKLNEMPETPHSTEATSEKQATEAAKTPAVGEPTVSPNNAAANQPTTAAPENAAPTTQTSIKPEASPNQIIPEVKFAITKVTTEESLAEAEREYMCMRREEEANLRRNMPKNTELTMAPQLQTPPAEEAPKVEFSDATAGKEVTINEQQVQQIIAEQSDVYRQNLGAITQGLDNLSLDQAVQISQETNTVLDRSYDTLVQQLAQDKLLYAEVQEIRSLMYEILGKKHGSGGGAGSGSGGGGSSSQTAPSSSGSANNMASSSVGQSSSGSYQGNASPVSGVNKQVSSEIMSGFTKHVIGGKTFLAPSDWDRNSYNRKGQNAEVESWLSSQIADVSGAKVSSRAGWRKKTNARMSEYHAGIDVVGGRPGQIEGANLKAFMGGQVLGTYTQRDKSGKMSGYGQYVMIQGDDGLIYKYAHMQGFGVQKGQRVEAGQVIGQAGHTGDGTGSHLHFEIRRGGAQGDIVDPIAYAAEIMKMRESGKLPSQVNQQNAPNAGNQLGGVVRKAPTEQMQNLLNQHGDFIASTAQKYNLPLDVLLGQIQQESGGNAQARSKAGAVGLMQLMPRTADSLGVKDRTNARESIEAGARYMSQLMTKYKGNLNNALMAYNWGMGNVDKYLKGLKTNVPAEAREYADKVLDKAKNYDVENGQPTQAQSQSPSIQEQPITTEQAQAMVTPPANVSAQPSINLQNVKNTVASSLSNIIDSAKGAYNIGKEKAISIYDAYKNSQLSEAALEIPTDTSKSGDTFRASRIAEAWSNRIQLLRDRINEAISKKPQLTASASDELDKTDSVSIENLGSVLPVPEFPEDIAAKMSEFKLPEDIKAEVSPINNGEIMPEMPISGNAAAESQTGYKSQNTTVIKAPIPRVDQQTQITTPPVNNAPQQGQLTAQDAMAVVEQEKQIIPGIDNDNPNALGMGLPGFKRIEDSGNLYAQMYNTAEAYSAASGQPNRFMGDSWMAQEYRVKAGLQERNTALDNVSWKNYDHIMKDKNLSIDDKVKAIFGNSDMIIQPNAANETIIQQGSEAKPEIADSITKAEVAKAELMSQTAAAAQQNTAKTLTDVLKPSLDRDSTQGAAGISNVGYAPQAAPLGDEETRAVSELVLKYIFGENVNGAGVLNIF